MNPLLLYIWLFGKKIDFERIDYIKLIPTKNEVKCKVFCDQHILVKMSLNIKLFLKINYRINKTTNYSLK